MRFRNILPLVVVLLGACSPNPAPQAPQALPATAGGVANAEPAPESAATVGAAPAPAAAVDAAPATAQPSQQPAVASAVSAAAAEPDPIAIEKTPGLTLAFPDGTMPAPASDASLPGRAGPSPAMGPEDAPVVVFVFSDFQCPVCRRAVEPLKKLVRDHDPLVRVVFKHQALASHSDARAAAIASLAAFRQGKFWQYHDRVFASTAGLSDDALTARAEEVNLDLEAFKAAREDETLGAQVDYETALGTALGVRGTPGFVVNGALSVGWGSYLSLNQKVEQAVTKWRESGKPASIATARALTAVEDPRAAEGLFPRP